MDGNESASDQLLRASLTTLRSKFEAGALRFQGCKLSICRESFEPYVMPVFAASQADYPDFRKGLRPLIGHDVDGMLGISSESFADSKHFCHWWLIHDELRSINLSSTKYHFDDLWNEVDRTSHQCESLFKELVEEGGRLLANFSHMGCDRVDEFLAMPSQRFNSGLWLAALIEFARDSKLKTPLQVTRTVPRGIGLDLFECTGGKDIPNSVIANLNYNPFSASAMFVDLLLANLGQQEKEPPEHDGPCDPFSWQLNGSCLEEKLSTKAWRLAEYLFQRRPKLIAFAELGEPVFQDSVVDPDYSQISSYRTEVNRFLEKHGIPWIIRTSDKMWVYMEPFDRSAEKKSREL
jgi:hypothetical protein